jgi:hypothetical protein
MSRLTNKEYAALAEEYEKNPPELSGKPGFITQQKQRALVNELLDPNYARIVNAKANATSMSPEAMEANRQLTTDEL